MRYLTTLAAGFTAASLCLTAQAQTLVVGDQSYNAQAVMGAAGVLDDLPYTLDWKQFTAGSPVVEALNVGSLDIGLLGDAPVLFLGALFKEPLHNDSKTAQTRRPDHGLRRAGSA